MTLPAPLAKLAPYAKFLITVVAIAAGVVVHVVAGPPAWVLLIVAVAGALGVVTVPNQLLTSQIEAVVANLKLTTVAGKIVLQDVKTGDVHDVQTDAQVFVTDVHNTVVSVAPVVTGVEATIAGLKTDAPVAVPPVVPTGPAVLPSELPTPPQPIKPAPEPPAAPTPPPTA